MARVQTVLQLLIRAPRHVPMGLGAPLRIFGICVGASALLAGVAALIVLLPPALLGINEPAIVAKMGPQDRITAVNNLRGVFLQAFAGLGLAVTIYFTARTFQLNRRGQVTDRFTKAIEQLGSEHMDVRIGGIYALEQIARDSRDLHRPIMEILTVFLREHTGPPQPLKATPKQGDSHEEPPSVRADLQAIVTVIGRRDRRHDPEGFRLDFHGVVLRQVDFKEAHLEDAGFSDADLQGAYFESAHLERARFEGAHLEGAKFLVAHLESTSFNDTHLEGAQFSLAYLASTLFLRAICHETKFHFAHLDQPVFTLARSILQKYGEVAASGVLEKDDTLGLTWDNFMGAKGTAVLPKYLLMLERPSGLDRTLQTAD